MGASPTWKAVKFLGVAGIFGVVILAVTTYTPDVTGVYVLVLGFALLVYLFQLTTEDNSEEST